MKKLIIWLTIFSFMNLIGCHYQEQMNPGDYTFDENSTIKITTKDTVYNFSGDDYSLVNDTLIGIMAKKLDERTTLKINFGIPVENIESVEVDRTDVLLTTILVVGILIIPVTLIIAAITLDGGGENRYYPNEKKEF